MRWPARATRLLAAAVLAAAVAPAPVAALEWGGIDPGQSTMEAVRGRFGQPTRTSIERVDAYESARWVYEGELAPAGLERMVIDFGLLTPGGFRPEIVRSLLLHPRSGAFNRNLVLQGWGEPTGVGQQSGVPTFMYEEGLFVSFDEDIWEVRTMLFTPKQTIPKPQDAPPR
jgi:hypothetical protein